MNSRGSAVLPLGPEWVSRRSKQTNPASSKLINSLLALPAVIKCHCKAIVRTDRCQGWRCFFVLVVYTWIRYTVCTKNTVPFAEEYSRRNRAAKPVWIPIMRMDGMVPISSSNIQWKSHVRLNPSIGKRSLSKQKGNIMNRQISYVYSSEKETENTGWKQMRAFSCQKMDAVVSLSNDRFHTLPLN